MINHLEASINIGTSGWNYKHWYGVFYPDKLKQRELLEFYTKYFDTVEINSSFYRLPPPETFGNWADKVPENFLFSVKANRYITHLKRLINVKEALTNFLKSVEKLGKKLGVILFQLPPSFKYDLERLEGFFKLLPVNFRYAVEFRNKKWFNEEVYDLLVKNGIIFCIFHFYPILAPDVITANTVYLRFHGSTGPYRGKYDSDFLRIIAGKIVEWNSQGKEVFCYFDNDEKGYAVINAMELKKIVSEMLKN